MDIMDSNIVILNSAFKIVDGVLTGLDEIIVDELETNHLNAKYANIDFSNINYAAVKKIFSESGIIKDLVVKEGTITGELVGVTIKGDLIEANTLRADRLIVKGENGIYYKLNLDSLGQTTVDSDEKYQNGLDGSVIIAKSITADRVSVSDLVAFGATIGGFNIDDHSIYSGVKSSINNTTRGIYADDQGQINIGDSNNFIKYFLDNVDKKWKLQISASVITMGGNNKTLEETVSEIQDELETIRDSVTVNLVIESSRGTVFKNNLTTTILSVVVYRGADRITNMKDLKEVFGNNVYLQWRWMRVNDNSYGAISSNDKHISDDGFKYTLTPDDVDDQVTFMCELIDYSDVQEYYPSNGLYPDDKLYPMSNN